MKIMMMNEHEIIIDFINQCQSLEEMMRSLFVIISSDRVRVSVMCILLKEIVNSQEDPSGALEQVINDLMDKNEIN